MDKNTMIRTIVALIVAILDGLKILGISIGADTEAIYGAVTLAVGIWIWWKNNNITPEAKTAQKVLDDMKANRNKEWETVEEPEDSEVHDGN